MPTKDSVVSITMYTADHEAELFALLEGEGDEWHEYWDDDGKSRYLLALSHSLVYVLHDGDRLCGFLRAKDDDGFGIYVYDLLVDATYRGKEYGRILLEHIANECTPHPVYVMSDVDPYYRKLGYKNAGSIFAVRSA